MTPTIRSIVARTLIAAFALIPLAVSAQQVRGPGRSAGLSTLGIHGFSVVLVVGSFAGTTATAATENVPEAARKALADMKDFLPYKRYQLLDAAWMLCCSSVAGSNISGRVRGPDDRDFRYSVDPLTVTDAKLNVRFAIREVGPVARPSATDVKGQNPPSDHTRALDAEREAMERFRGSGQNIIDSTFAIAAGETVVVGTSRLNGDRALIAILTAAGKPTPTANR